MGVNEMLFRKMTEKIRDLACDEPDFKPSKEDISNLFMALSILVDGMDKTTSAVDTACAALGIASGEFSNDMGYFICERGDNYDYLLECMVENGILERLDGDNHTAYIRI